MAKPRTNADACAYWADSIREREPRAELEVNSIRVSRDVIFSFGSHYPMGVIERRDDGSVRRVWLTADHYGSRGFANTSGDQWCAHALAKEICTELRIPVRYSPMASGREYQSNGGMVRCRPKASDPEPPSRWDWQVTIPVPYSVSNPGPEPVDDGVGCMIGHREEYTYQEEVRIYTDMLGDSMRKSLPAGAHPRGLTGEGKSYEATVYTVWRTGVLTYREPKCWETSDLCNSGEEDKVCVHCLRFANRHRAWREKYHGSSYGRGRGEGYALMCEMLERFGSYEEWRRERTVDWRRVKAGRRAWDEWYARNHMPVDELPTMSSDWSSPLRYVRVVDEDGYAYRKHSEAYFLRQREIAREKAAMERRRLARERERQQIERFAASIRRRRKPTFVEVANEAAINLRNMHESITTERES